jgi:hypothetical protein
MLILSGFLISCATSNPAPTPALLTARPYVPEPGWSLVRAGLERREIDIFVENRQVDHLFLVRIDPNLYKFEIAYDAEQPKSISDWQRQTRALLVFNAGYFRVEKTRYLPVGLLVLGGQVFGESFRGFGGMFVVMPHTVELRSLVEQPYGPGESLLYALQSFPLLVKPGGTLGFPAEYEDEMIARRTVLGRDRKGRFVVLVTASSYFTLHRLSLYLVNSDLNLDIALNLDGGPSSGVVLAEPYSGIPAASFLPMVVTVFPR